ncbi:MAG TPA: FecR family protein [Mucilaginibacter sp.]|jgi:transmembrane sensor|nr:FecR family protein [Mucilaginibacter sp.]
MIKNEFSIPPYELIIRSFEEPLSADEQKLLASWRAISATNEDLYQQLNLISADIELLPVYQRLNPDVSWNKFSLLLEKHHEPVNIVELNAKPAGSFIKKLSWVLPIAASLLLVTWFTINQNRNNTINTVTLVRSGLHQHKKIVLTDGTEVLLNENTRVSYNKYSYNQNRKIDLLEGEAFFTVVHNAARPFKVNIDKIVVKDIGTSFNIRKEQHAVVVVVNSGIVSLINQANGSNVLLRAKQKGIYDMALDNITWRANEEINYKAWADKNLEFIKAPLQDVVRELKDTYGADIYIEDNALNNKILTASFRNQPIDSVLNFIGMTLHIKIEKRDNTFYLKKDLL